MTSLATAPSIESRAIPRFEDDALLRGTAAFVGDIRIPGLLHLAIARSPYPYGRLDGVDLSAAHAFPGVVDAFAAGDLASPLGPIPSRLPIPEHLAQYLQRPLASGEVRYVGQPCAVVVATSPEGAREAADRVVLEIEPADPPAEDVLHTDEVEAGDLPRAFAAAAVVVRETYTIARQAGVPLECRGLLADFVPETGELTVWAAAKSPHFLHGAIARALELPPERVHLNPVETGGGFGVRGEMHPEDVLVPLAAMRSGRAVRWLEERLEHLQSAYQSRGQVWEAALAVSAEGTILGLDCAFRSDLGAFIGPNGLTPARVALRAYPGPYRVPAHRCEATHVRTCKPPLGTMRGPGYFEAGFARESLLDLAAAELGLEPAELRRRNLISESEMPYDTRLEGIVYDGGDYRETLEQALAGIEGGAASPGMLGGSGVACMVEGSGTPGAETAVARLSDGRISVTVGSASFGQGHATSFAQVVAAVLGVRADEIDILEGASEHAGGTFASRSAVMAGSACHEAARALREAIETKATEILGGETTLEDGRPCLTDGSGLGLDLSELGELAEYATFTGAGAAYTYGACAARVEVDPDTGVVRLLELVVAVDAGFAINPPIVHGQLAGGAVQGAGGALFEQLEYTGEDEPVTGGLRDYHLPRGSEMPDVKVIVLELVPSPRNPLGVRGVGEISTAGAAAAIANAVSAATRPHGARVTTLPIAPWRLVEAFDAARSGRGQNPL